MNCPHRTEYGRCTIAYPEFGPPTDDNGTRCSPEDECTVDERKEFERQYAEYQKNVNVAGSEKIKYEGKEIMPHYVNDVPHGNVKCPQRIGRGNCGITGAKCAHYTECYIAIRAVRRENEEMRCLLSEIVNAATGNWAKWMDERSDKWLKEAEEIGR